MGASSSTSASRKVARLETAFALALAGFMSLASVPSIAQDKSSCPEVIASLLPKNGVIRGGQYAPAGPMGMGSGAVDLPFEHPCLKSDKYPARLSLAVSYYGGEMAELLKMQGDAVDEQTLQNAASEFERSKRPVKTEVLGEGRIVYYEYMTDCPVQDGAADGVVLPKVPNVKLKGVARTDNVRLEVELEGRISTALAKAAVSEVFENLKKSRFDKAK